jgi:hypothetical protein
LRRRRIKSRFHAAATAWHRRGSVQQPVGDHLFS